MKNSGGTTGRSLVWQRAAAASHETAVAWDPARGDLPARMQPVPEPSLLRVEADRAPSVLRALARLCGFGVARALLCVLPGPRPPSKCLCSPPSEKDNLEKKFTVANEHLIHI